MFRDRVDAGERLARALKRYKGRAGLLVLAVPRGGLPVGAVLARELGAELDVALVKKIGHPNDPEFAIGAVSPTGTELDLDVLRREGVSTEYAVREAERLREILLERRRFYRGGAPAADVRGRTVILADDGAATGRTLSAAASLLKEDGAAKVVAAVPVGSPEAVAALRRRADEVVCLETPDDFTAIGRCYRDFAQVSDEEAAALLRDGARS
jgi:predicted phosphoribosyltransferase